VGQRLTPTRLAVEGYLDALNAHDADRVASWVAPDFVNEHTAAGAVSRHGRAAYRAALDRFLADFAGLHYAPEQVIVDGPNCAVPYRMTALLNGRPLDIRGVFVFVVGDDGLIAKRTDYWDSAGV
jgi:ketosteroid isomerase-like protein